MATMENPVGSILHHPYPPLPASPTLTNPDMILPDYDRASSPGLDEQRAQSPLMMWKNAHAAASGADLQQLYTTPSSQHGFPAGPITPTTPIIYGNGTMLSDIGEVTEVESTPGRPSPSRHRVVSPHHGLKERDGLVDAALRSSPTVGLESGVKMRAKQQASQERLRRSSIDSNSTITTQDQAGLFADFDDTISVGDSVFQGDDEESVADSYVEQSPVRDVHAASRLTAPSNVVSGGGSSGGDASGNEDRQSTASLSRRAEQILANAKRRLTTMEGNLSRARSSLYVTSPSSLSSLPSDSSTPSPPIPLRSASVLREARDSSSPTYAPGHARMGSDNTLRIGLPVNVYPQRSQSALGAAGGYRQPLTGSKSVDQMRDSLSGGYSRSNYKTSEMALEPLSEDEASPNPQPDNRTSAQLEAFLSPTFGGFNEKGLTRSASVAQMRDLKDQMKDLKGKISSLREQARADSLKRRSLQSLRTPSPFTHAQVDQWYAEPKSEQSQGSSSKGSSGRNPWNGELSSVDGEHQEGGADAKGEQAGQDAEPTDEESILSGYEEAEDGVTQLSHPSQPNQQFAESPVLGDADVPEPAAAEVDEDDEDDMRTENGDAEEVEDEAALAEEEAYENESESGESAYHDTLQHPVSHEDREDAFDYEHFILHSALGTISQQRLAGRAGRGSFSSEGSVETTRGPIVETKDSSPDKDTGTASRGRGRRGSAGSTSTMESFATATEGRASRTNRSSSGSDDTGKNFREQIVDAPSNTGQESPLTAKKMTFTSVVTGGITKRNSAEEPRQTQQPPVARRPASSAATTLHRPSISSFESTGTNRSFPLVTRKSNVSTGVVTPNSSSSGDEELRKVSETLLNETASICEQAADSAGSNDSGHGYSSSRSSGRSASSLSKGDPHAPAAMQLLMKEDQYLVERLVASLGRCVLGLTETGRAGSESRMYRRRIDAARRILEGLDSV